MSGVNTQYMPEVCLPYMDHPPPPLHQIDRNSQNIARDMELGGMRRGWGDVGYMGDTAELGAMVAWSPEIRQLSTPPELEGTSQGHVKTTATVVYEI